MFAFALWDKRKGELLLARDRVGIKPLYVLRTPTTLAFASEIKAIAAAGLSMLRVDWRALGRMMRFLVVPQPETIFQDIRKLEPGRLLTSNANGEVRERTYWAPAPAVGAMRADEEDQLSLVESALRDSVNCHLVADVPVGAFLSGGLDSSAVVALMRDLQPGREIRAFSVEFPGLQSFDEGPFARKVAQLKQIDFHSTPVDADFANDLDRIAWHLDEPFAIGSAYATYYLARYAASELKVVLTGDGGDELFAGYEGYGNDRYLQGSIVGRLADLNVSLIRAASRTASGRAILVPRILPGLLHRSGGEGLRYSEQVSQNNLGALSTALRPEAFVRCVQDWSDNLVAKYYDELSSPDRLARKLYADYKTRLVDEMLMKVDRMTMAHSLEARVPLLDHKLVELAFQLPSTMKRRALNGGGYESKYVVKRVMEKYLPRDIVYREKHGFNVPVGVWMGNGLSDRIGERLLGGALQEAGILSRRGVRRLLDGAGSDARANHGMLMALVALESWAEAYQQRVGRILWG
jgi:asparagine synthase (glutamine-hydrolysing)